MKVLRISQRYNPEVNLYYTIPWWPLRSCPHPVLSLRACGSIVPCSFSRCPTIRLETRELVIWLRYPFTWNTLTWEIMHLNQSLSCFKLYSAYCVVLCNLISLRPLTTSIFQTLAEFALTHEEVVERRKLLLERTQDVSAAMSNIDTHPTLKCIQILNMNVSSSDLSTFWIHSLCHLSVIFEGQFWPVVCWPTSLSTQQHFTERKQRGEQSQKEGNMKWSCGVLQKLPWHLWFVK